MVFVYLLNVIQATQQDELTLREGELLTILDHGTGDGWFRVIVFL